MVDRWQETHPFIAFHLDGRRLDDLMWIALGECSSKIQHVSGVPLQPETAAQLNKIFLAKGAHATTAIEGNTLSEDEVARRVAGDLELPKSRGYLGQEVDNVVAAYNFLVERVVEGAPARVGTDEFKILNTITLKGLELDAQVIPGRFRDHIVGVNGYRAPPAEFIPELLERFCSWMNNPVWERDMGAPFVLPILKAIVGHLYFAWIHPFGDGNGRTARLIEFDILTRAGVPTASAHLLSDHYNRTRPMYYRALSQAQRDSTIFIRYALQGFLDGLREQLKTIREQQMNVTWINYVHMMFRNEQHTQARERRREVAISLSFEADPVSRDAIPSLNPQLAALYGTRHLRSLDRDIETLSDMGLIGFTSGGLVFANSDYMLAFLPLARRAPSVTEPVLHVASPSA